IEQVIHLVFENKPLQLFLTGQKELFILEKDVVLVPDQAKKFLNAPSNQIPEKQTVVLNSNAAQPVAVVEQTGNKLIEVGSKDKPTNATKVNLAGYVRDANDGAALVGATVYAVNAKVGVVTDAFGYFTIKIPSGRNTLNISSSGMKPSRREIMAYGDGQLVIELKENVPTLKAVTIVVEKNSNVRRMQMGVEKLTARNIKSVPVLLGEPDVLRVLLTLPGVTSVGEASTGFNVRGGSTDQNLILLNDATIYNPSHVFGFFSAFNPDQIKSAELYKSSIPERYGGRLSSVLDITTREGNAKKWTGNAGIGPLTSKFNIEGPLVKDKTTLLAGARTSYSDWIIKQLPDPTYKKSSASFYDVNLHLSHQFSKKDDLFLTVYKSADHFRLGNDTTFSYANQNIVAKWKHVFNNKLYTTVTAGQDEYGYQVKGDVGSVKGYNLQFGIKQWHVRNEYAYTLNNKHSLNFGVSMVNYTIEPGKFTPLGNGSKVAEDKVNKEQARELALYVGDKFSISDKLSLNLGYRHSLFQSLGQQKVYQYAPGLPRDQSTIVDSTIYGKGKVARTYQGPELRLALRYVINETSSLKFSYNNIRQYIHLLSNTTAISPTDIWKLSDTHIKPQLGQQVSLGFYKDFPKQSLETSIELYYKSINNFLDYKSGAQIVMNKQIERDVLTTKGKAYGAEFMVKKTSGKLNGWMSYAYSRILLSMDDPIAGQIINKGNPYPANFDKPHAVNFVGNYKFTHRYALSLNIQYSTGRPITLPIAIFELGGSQRVLYSERNQYRVPDYFRTDLSFNMEGNHKVKQKTHNSWSVGVYNLTGRKNPYSVYFVEENGKIKGYKLSVIGTAIPYITYNIRF
ncbi:MAG: hypothetical protein RL642_1208, partial [Bacteroidota bacterium]